MATVHINRIPVELEVDATQSPLTFSELMRRTARQLRVGQKVRVRGAGHVTIYERTDARRCNRAALTERESLRWG